MRYRIDASACGSFPKGHACIEPDGLSAPASLPLLRHLAACSPDSEIAAAREPSAEEHRVMKLASYNVENLFQRAHAMNLDTQAEGRAALRMHAQLNGILNKIHYTTADKEKIVSLME